MTLLQLSLPDLVGELGHDVTTLRAWFRGANRFSFEDMDHLDGFFAARGLPGLMDELRQHGMPRNWHFTEESYTAAHFDDPAMGDLHELTTGLQQSGRPPLTFLQERGLFDHCHLLNVDGGAVRPIHLGDAIPIRPSQSVLGRDLRELNDRDFGLMLHNQLMKISQLQAPRVHLIRSVSGPQVEYRRLAVPVGPHFIVTFPYDLSIAPTFSLQ